MQPSLWFQHIVVYTFYLVTKYNGNLVAFV